MCSRIILKQILTHLYAEGVKHHLITIDLIIGLNTPLKHLFKIVSKFTILGKVLVSITRLGPKMPQLVIDIGDFQHFLKGLNCIPVIKNPRPRILHNLSRWRLKHKRLGDLILLMGHLYIGTG
jgi:hypothetical protein